MGKFVVLFVTGLVLAILPGIFFYIIFKDTEAPHLPEYFWGPKSKESKPKYTNIRPFNINISSNILNDLKLRLKLETSQNGNRLVKPLEGVAFEYGFNTDFLKTITNHWLNKYDWIARQTELNKYPHFKTTIAGIEIHFQHIKYNGEKIYKTTRPLLLLHGWPGSFVEFQKAIPLLTNPEETDINFEVIIPSIPGYGFSERAHKPGLGPAEISQIFYKLMLRLGYKKYYVQGGDWGSIIASHMAAIYPKNVMGLHMNMCVSTHRRTLARILIGSIYPTFFMEEHNLNKIYPISTYLSNLIEESGYFHIQATKPDTIGVSLSNSPSGLVAYILEKFSTHTNKKWKALSNGGLVPYYNLDELLDNIMIYWVTNSITSSIRLYSEAFTGREMIWKFDNVPVIVPTGCLENPNEMLSIPNQWLLQDKYPNLVSFTRSDKGGHFSAFEVPLVFAKDVIKFFNYLETNQLSKF